MTCHISLASLIRHRPFAQVIPKSILKMPSPPAESPASAKPNSTKSSLPSSAEAPADAPAVTGVYSSAPRPEPVEVVLFEDDLEAPVEALTKPSKTEIKFNATMQRATIVKQKAWKRNDRIYCFDSVQDVKTQVRRAADPLMRGNTSLFLTHRRSRIPSRKSRTTTFSRCSRWTRSPTAASNRCPMLGSRESKQHAESVIFAKARHPPDETFPRVLPVQALIFHV